MMLTDIEVEFAKLRDQLDNNKMARYVAEIEMCAEGTHPDLEKACSDIQSVQHERVKGRATAQVSADMYRHSNSSEPGTFTPTVYEGPV